MGMGRGLRCAVGPPQNPRQERRGAPWPSSGGAPQPQSPPSRLLLSPVCASCWALPSPSRGCCLSPPPSCPHHPRGLSPALGIFFLCPLLHPGALPLPSMVTICPQPYPQFFFGGGTPIKRDRKFGRRGVGARAGEAGGALEQDGTPRRGSWGWKGLAAGRGARAIGLLPCLHPPPQGTRPRPGVLRDLLAVPPGRRSTPKTTHSPKRLCPRAPIAGLCTPKPCSGVGSTPMGPPALWAGGARKGQLHFVPFLLLLLWQ